MLIVQFALIGTLTYFLWHKNGKSIIEKLEPSAQKQVFGIISILLITILAFLSKEIIITFVGIEVFSSVLFGVSNWVISLLIGLIVLVGVRIYVNKTNSAVVEESDENNGFTLEDLDEEIDEEVVEIGEINPSANTEQSKKANSEMDEVIDLETLNELLK